MASKVLPTKVLLFVITMPFYTLVFSWAGSPSPPTPPPCVSNMTRPPSPTSPAPCEWPSSNMTCPPPLSSPPFVDPSSNVTAPPAMPPTSPSTPVATNTSCPNDALKLGVCASVLKLIKLKVGHPPKYPCCSLLDGLIDLEAAVCLCLAIKADILGIDINIPIDLSLILNYCGKEVPTGFKCA